MNVKWFGNTITTLLLMPLCSMSLAEIIGTPEKVRHYDLRPLTELRFVRSHMQFGDLNGDDRIDFLVYSNSLSMAAFADDGDNGLTKLWEYTAPVSLPVPPEKPQYKYVVWDIDADGRNEVVGPFASLDGKIELRILDAATGEVERSVATTLDNRSSSDDINSTRIRLTVANFRGNTRPQDVVLIGENNSRGDIWVYDNELNLLWDTLDDDVYIHAHFPWTRDIDADGFDELIGKWIIDQDGSLQRYILDDSEVPRWARHLDKAYIGDFDSANPGLELWTSHEFYQARMVDSEGNVLWATERGHPDDKLHLVGNFSASNPGYEGVSENATRGTMDVYDTRGRQLVSLPAIENGSSLAMDWDGDRSKDEAYFAKRGGFIWDPMDGDFVDVEEVFESHRETVDSIEARNNGKVADLCGDQREEIAIVDEDEIIVYRNSAINSHFQASPWETIPEYPLIIANQQNDNHIERQILPMADVLTSPASRHTPQNVALSLNEGGVDLTWEAATESDIQSYNVYRSSYPCFRTERRFLIAERVMDTAHTDPSISENPRLYYRITAVVDGVESLASNEVATVSPNTMGDYPSADEDPDSIPSPNTLDNGSSGGGGATSILWIALLILSVTARHYVTRNWHFNGTQLSGSVGC